MRRVSVDSFAKDMGDRLKAPRGSPIPEDSASETSEKQPVGDDSLMDPFLPEPTAAGSQPTTPEEPPIDGFQNEDIPDEQEEDDTPRGSHQRTRSAVDSIRTNYPDAVIKSSDPVSPVLVRSTSTTGARYARSHVESGSFSDATVVPTPPHSATKSSFSIPPTPRASVIITDPVGEHQVAVHGDSGEPEGEEKKPVLSQQRTEEEAADMMKRRQAGSPLSLLIQEMGGRTGSPTSSIVGGVSPDLEGGFGEKLGVPLVVEGEAPTVGSEEEGALGEGRLTDSPALLTVAEAAPELPFAAPSPARKASLTPPGAEPATLQESPKEAVVDPPSSNQVPHAVKKVVEEGDEQEVLRTMKPRPGLGVVEQSEITPRTAKRWSIDEMEEAYTRMRAMVGSRSGSASVASTMGDDEGGNDSDNMSAFERALADASLHGMDFENVDPGLKNLLSPNTLSSGSPGRRASIPSSPEGPFRRSPLRHSLDETRLPSPAGVEEEEEEPLSDLPSTPNPPSSSGDSKLSSHSPLSSRDGRPAHAQLRALSTGGDLQAIDPAKLSPPIGGPSRMSPTRPNTSDGVDPRQSLATPEPGWPAPLNSASPGRRSDFSGTSPASVRLKNRVLSSPSKPMRSEAGRQWAKATGFEVSVSPRKSSLSSSDAGSFTEGSNGNRRSDITISTQPTSRSKWTNSPSPPGSGRPANIPRPSHERISSYSSYGRRSMDNSSNAEAWYDEDTPRKPPPPMIGRPPIPSRLSHRRDISDMESVAGSMVSSSTQAIGSVNDARSMTKIDIFLLASKLQAELETTQKQAAIDKEALLDALRESRDVVSDLRAQRNELNSGRSMASMARELQSVREDRDAWRRRAEETTRLLRNKDEELRGMRATIDETRDREDHLQLQNERLQTRADSMANELKRAVVDLRSASAAKLPSSNGHTHRAASSIRSDTDSLGSGTTSASVRPSRLPAPKSSPPVGRIPRAAKERTPSLASNGPLLNGFDGTPISATTFKFAPPSGHTPMAELASRTKNLPIPIRANGTRSFLPRHRQISANSTASGDSAPNSPSPAAQALHPGATSPGPALSPLFQSETGSPTSTIFADHLSKSTRFSSGSNASGSLHLTPEDEQFLGDFEDGISLLGGGSVCGLDESLEF